MTIDIFVPTERRKVRVGEFFKDVNVWSEWVGPNPSVCEHQIGIRHQVEVPKDATHIDIFPCTSMGVPLNLTQRIIPLPRPKKVKKWRWVICLLGGTPYITNEYRSSEDINNTFHSHLINYKMLIPQTEIEVDDD